MACQSTRSMYINTLVDVGGFGTVLLLDKESEANRLRGRPRWLITQCDENRFLPSPSGPPASHPLHPVYNVRYRQWARCLAHDLGFGAWICGHVAIAEELYTMLLQTLQPSTVISYRSNCTLHSISQHTSRTNTSVSSLSTRVMLLPELAAVMRCRSW